MADRYRNNRGLPRPRQAQRRAIPHPRPVGMRGYDVHYRQAMINKFACRS